ncbi:hypothetical protein [[Mycoplasma] collis]|uniref:hypothetical protein n=1 Tax=[Mycoplasma] collis TaxID=2127 RepID=UPI00068EE8F0|nr:hypothetical protein [[Mycoplasma] collis]
MYGYNKPKHSFTYVEEKQKEEVLSMYENKTNNGVLPNFIFYYNTQERIVMNKFTLFINCAKKHLLPVFLN